MPRRKTLKSGKGPSTTEIQHKFCFSKWWKKFCCHKKMPHTVPRFVDDTGIVTDEANTLFCEFTKLTSAQPGMSLSKRNKSFNQLQWELGNKVGSYNKPSPVVHMRRLKMVDGEAKKIKKAICELEKTDDDGEIAFFDMQSKVESDMSDEKKMMAVKSMLNNDRVPNASQLNAIKFLVDFTSTHALS